MKKMKLNKGRLSLKPELVRVLSREDLGRVRGGDAISANCGSDTCWPDGQSTNI